MAGVWPFGDLRMFGYSVILADPPWSFENYSEAGEKKNPKAHYSCSPVDELGKLPVGHLAGEHAALVMWATAPMLDQAFELMRLWGFTFKTMGGWGKRSSTGRKWQFGPGYILRSTLEPYLIGTVGSPERRSRSVRNFIEAPVREHSRKPERMYDDLEALYDGPYCELFARNTRPGWDSWGNETTKFDGGE